MEAKQAKIMERFGKLKIALHYYLLGRKYNTALKAFHFAARHHAGLRRDKMTPEFQHQIEIALYVSTLKDVRDEERVITLALLHDLLEDYSTVTMVFLASEFGHDIADECELLNKNGKSYEVYFDRMAMSPSASIVKGADRIHNINSMVGVFSKEKQQKYCAEVEQYFLPMLKKARKTHPDQLQAYSNIEHMLRSQINLLRGE
jgi:(p)ppGpp synthase/HD superfamily hydrolase